MNHKNLTFNDKFSKINFEKRNKKKALEDFQNNKSNYWKFYNSFNLNKNIGFLSYAPSANSDKFLFDIEDSTYSDNQRKIQVFTKNELGLTVCRNIKQHSKLYNTLLQRHIYTPHFVNNKLFHKNGIENINYSFDKELLSSMFKINKNICTFNIEEESDVMHFQIHYDFNDSTISMIDFFKIIRDSLNLKNILYFESHINNQGFNFATQFNISLDKYERKIFQQIINEYFKDFCNAIIYCHTPLILPGSSLYQFHKIDLKQKNYFGIEEIYENKNDFFKEFLNIHSLEHNYKLSDYTCGWIFNYKTCSLMKKLTDEERKKNQIKCKEENKTIFKNRDGKFPLPNKPNRYISNLKWIEQYPEFFKINYDSYIKNLYKRKNKQEKTNPIFKEFALELLGFIIYDQKNNRKIKNQIHFHHTLGIQFTGLNSLKIYLEDKHKISINIKDYLKLFLKIFKIEILYYNNSPYFWGINKKQYTIKGNSINLIENLLLNFNNLYVEYKQKLKMFKNKFYKIIINLFNFLYIESFNNKNNEMLVEIEDFSES